LTKSTDGAGHTLLCGYDSVGNQITLTNRNGKKWQFQFDAADHLTNTITPLGRSNFAGIQSSGIASLDQRPGRFKITSLY